MNLAQLQLAWKRLSGHCCKFSISLAWCSLCCRLYFGLVGNLPRVPHELYLHQILRTLVFVSVLTTDPQLHRHPDIHLHLGYKRCYMTLWRPPRSNPMVVALLNWPNITMPLLMQRLLSQESFRGSTAFVA
jgi:hypothetical protein